MGHSGLESQHDGLDLLPRFQSAFLKIKCTPYLFLAVPAGAGTAQSESPQTPSINSYPAPGRRRVAIAGTTDAAGTRIQSAADSD